MSRLATVVNTLPGRSGPFENSGGRRRHVGKVGGDGWQFTQGPGEKAHGQPPHVR